MQRIALLLLVAVVALVPKVGLAGSKDGPRRWTKVVPKNSDLVYKIVYVQSNEPSKAAAEFAVIGDGNTDVDIEVYDAAGKLVSKDDGFTDLGLVRWRPASTQEFTIRVKNLGSEDNTCVMGHN
jgi:hypothetical protein